MATDPIWKEEDSWKNYNNPQESNENSEWIFQIKTEPFPDISTIVLPYNEFEDIFEREIAPMDIIKPHPFIELPGFNVSKYGFLELPTWEGIEENLGNIYWKQIPTMDEHLRK
ncbi:hypothetical protein O181_052299 [Austropuccinia psidii MF-1]|uniref:Uncharacterized protein n=1 Tax=Austropuccinia psidii MF-1 TaxID=1389203 RepID=A0A9Q3E0E1_9BASI|nr:hypothetical protein [Austropuccinia psidii MF-1]